MLAYFGEMDSKPCGQCDVCRGEHLSGISNAEFGEISKKIVQMLTSKPMSINEITGGMEGNDKKVLRVVRWMIDQGNLEISKSNQLNLKQGRSPGPSDPAAE